MGDGFLLNIDSVSMHFGGIVALDGLSFCVHRGQICGLIGPNGAGKTTMFNVISRLYEPTSGRITFDGIDLLALAPHEIAAVGVARTFQHPTLFPGLNVLENVMVGAHTDNRGGFLRAALRLGTSRDERRVRERAYDTLDDLGIAHLAFEPVGSLSHGMVKYVDLARALAANPVLLLLDEPASGLTRGEVDALGETILELRHRHNLTIVLVEHHTSLVMSVSDKVVVLDLGKKIADGRPAAVQQDPAVIEAYLGSPV